MTEPIPYHQLLKAAMEWAAEYDSTLRADDPRFEHAVWILHGDGTSLFFRNAFIFVHERWLMVFSEHNRFHVYEPDDLSGFEEFAPVREKPRRLPALPDYPFEWPRQDE